MSDLKEYIDKQMNDPDFKLELEESRPEFEVMKVVIRARLESNMTQKELSAKTGIRQSNISRIESGACVPNITTLDTIAKGMGKKLHIEFR